MASVTISMNSLLASIAILTAFAPAAFAQRAEHIRAVENGLLPPYQIEGAPTPAWKLADRMQFYKVPAISIAVIHNGQLEWAQAYGVLETGGKAANAGTLFQAASISKPVTALAALSLVRKGKLSLDQNVNEKLTSWKVPDNQFAVTEKVTLRRLLSHSAGMTVHGFPGYAAGAPLPSLVEILNGQKPANTDPIRVDVLPGSVWRYSGGGFTVVQQLLIDVTGQPFPEILKGAVIGPIGMSRSTYQQPLPDPLRANAARAYRSDGKQIEGLWHTYPEMAAAGLWTTPSDLARFAIEVRKEARGESDRVVDQKLARQMLTRQKDDYGLGLGLSGEGDRLHLGHGGANEGYRCDFQMYLNSGDGAAIMTNSDNGSSLSAEVFRSIAAAYGWPDFKPVVKKVTRLDTATLKKYTGEYQLGEMKILVSVEGGKLWVTPPQGSKAELLPESATRFFIGDMNLPEVTFSIDAAGEATGFQAFGQTAKKVSTDPAHFK